jgi:hypothetical protein
VKYYLLVVIIGLVGLVINLNQKNIYSVIPIDQYQKLRAGVLIFRQGVDFTSQAVLNSRQKSVYSHVGIVVINKDEYFVLHSSPAENENDFNGVKLEKLALFSQSDRARHIAVMRVTEQEQVGKAAARKAEQYLGLAFDASFDLVDDSKIYCTELVVKAYKPLKINLLSPLRDVKVPFAQGGFLMPQDMFENESLKQVFIL